jgi:small-conductance mechanosensitive channel
MSNLNTMTPQERAFKRLQMANANQQMATIGDNLRAAIADAEKELESLKGIELQTANFLNGIREGKARLEEHNKALRAKLSDWHAGVGKNLDRLKGD